MDCDMAISSTRYQAEISEHNRTIWLPCHCSGFIRGYYTLQIPSKDSQIPSKNTMHQIMSRQDNMAFVTWTDLELLG